MNWPRGFAQYFNRCSIDTQPVVSKTRLPLLKQFKSLLQTRFKLVFVLLIYLVFFTNIPLRETIQICADSLYESNLTPPIIDKDVFIELINMATTSVEFSFNKKMYKQIGGVAVGSPRGLALANIFVGYQEEKLFIDNNQPVIYFSYVDDTFAMFKDEFNCYQFLKQLDSLPQSLTFTHEKEVSGKLPFLNVLFEKSNTKF